MNCFVIMPFTKEFDDVYASIKTNVETVISSRGGKCFRLDEARPAGPITDRLLREIQAAAFCVADVTGNIPNVMWEVGYAMALGKPIILITQKISELPFDIKDLQSLEYDRTQVSRTLAEPLRKMVLDTVQTFDTGKSVADPLKERDELVGTLLTEVKDLKSMLGNVVRAWEPSTENMDTPLSDISRLEGAWKSDENGSHYYAKVQNGKLIVPYCFMGNDQLTGVFYDWRRTGEYWFAKFVWLYADISGFVFLKQDTIDSLIGAWWHDSDDLSTPNTPPSEIGTSLRLKRYGEVEIPKWALLFLEEVQEIGLRNRIAQRKKWY